LRGELEKKIVEGIEDKKIELGETFINEKLER
jgi:hypothetical protein